MAADIGEHGERAGGDDGAADGESVEAVGEVDGVLAPIDDENDESDERQKREQAQMRNAAEPHATADPGESA